MANYVEVIWTNGDTITEAKMDNMVANDRAEDAHASGVHLNNAAAIQGQDSGSTLYDLIQVNGDDYLEMGEAGLEGIDYKIKRREQLYDNGNSGAAKTINWKNGSAQKLTLTANCTLTFSNVDAGSFLTFVTVQDGTGGRSITWPATTKGPEGVVDVTTTASAIDWFFIKAYAAAEYHVLGIVNDLQAV